MAKIQYKLQNFSRTPAPFTSNSPTQQLDLLADFLRLVLQGLDVVPLRLQLGRLRQSLSQSLTLPSHSVVVSVDIQEIQECIVIFISDERVNLGMIKLKQLT